METCPLCKNEFRNKTSQALSNVSLVDCEICGKYKISKEELLLLQSSFESEKYIISGITRQTSEDNKYVSIIDEQSIRQIIDTARIPDSPLEKMDLILVYIEKKIKHMGDCVHIDTVTDYPIAFAKHSDEMRYLLMIADRLIYINEDEPDKFSLTVDGWKHLSEILKEKIDSNQAFVAMWFNGAMDDAWENGFKSALKEMGYQPIRIDKENITGKIDDAIIAAIRKSGLLIADFTGMRSGVFFEAGFALGLGIPVIWTCNINYFKALNEHFDTRQYNHIEWNDPEDLKKKLITRIEATLPKKNK